MSLKESLREANIGGTARWVADAFLYYVANGLVDGDNFLSDQLIEFDVIQDLLDCKAYWQKGSFDSLVTPKNLGGEL